MQAKSDIENFVADWVERNVHSVRNLPNLPSEVDRLAAALTGAARAKGISGSDLHRTLGDIDDYLTEQYLKVSAAAA